MLVYYLLSMKNYNIVRFQDSLHFRVSIVSSFLLLKTTTAYCR